MRPSSTQKLALLLIALCLLSACAAPAAAPTATPPPSAILPPTAAPTSTATAAPTATAIPPTLTPTVPPATATLTPQPTLSPDEAKQAVQNLLANNGNCTLPCLWSFNPSQDGKQDIISFFNGFPVISARHPDTSVAYESRGSNAGFFSLLYSIGSTRIIVFFSHDSNGLSMSVDAVRKVDNNSSVAIFGDPDFNQAVDYYLLPHLMTTYGHPSQVLIVPFTGTPDFNVVVFYADQHFLVEYVSPNEKQGSSYVWYPDKIYSLEIVTWPPDQDLTLQEVVEMRMTDSYGVNDVVLPYFKFIEESTSMTIDDFYQRCKDSQETPCLETPVEKWKDLEQMWPDWNK